MADAVDNASELFDRFTSVDPATLTTAWDLITTQLRALDDEEQDLRKRRQQAEARRAVIASVATLVGVDLPDQTSGQPHPQPGANAREIARDVINQDDRRFWDAKGLHEALTARGVETSPSNVRVILQRFNSDGLLHRVSHGHYSKTAAAHSDSLLDGAESNET
jgi:hypothetical protein